MGDEAGKATVPSALRRAGLRSIVLGAGFSLVVAVFIALEDPNAARTLFGPSGLALVSLVGFSVAAFAAPLAVIELLAGSWATTRGRRAAVGALAGVVAFLGTLLASFQINYARGVLEKSSFVSGELAVRHWADQLASHPASLLIFALLAVGFVPLTLGRMRGLSFAPLLGRTVGIGALLAVPPFVGILLADRGWRASEAITLGLLVLVTHALLAFGAAAADRLEARIERRLAREEALS